MWQHNGKSNQLISSVIMRAATLKGFASAPDNGLCLCAACIVHKENALASGMRRRDAMRLIHSARVHWQKISGNPEHSISII
jgi:hypothetical protein